MQPSALTPENSAVVMIDHAVGFGNVFRSHDLSLHVNNTVGLAKTAGVFGIPLVLTNGADTGPYGPLFSELRAETGDWRVIVREGNFINEGCVLGSALAGLERGYEVYVAVDATAGETLEAHQVAVQRMIQAGVVPVTWLSLASQYQGSCTNHETVQGFLSLMTQHSAAFGMLFQGQAVRAR